MSHLCNWSLCHATKESSVGLGRTDRSRSNASSPMVGPVGLRFRIRRFGLGSVLVLLQLVRSGRSIVLFLGPIGPDRDRTETEVVQPCFICIIFHSLHRVSNFS